MDMVNFNNCDEIINFNGQARLGNISARVGEVLNYDHERSRDLLVNIYRSLDLLFLPME